MALLIARPTGNLEVVVFKDRAVTCDKEGYEAYQKSFAGGAGDESLLKLNGEPTRFVLRPELTWQAKQKLRSKYLKVQGRRVQIDANYSAEMLRLHLVAIKNPAGVPAEKTVAFSKDPDDMAARSLINMLDGAGVIPDLVGALQAVNKLDEDIVKNG